MNIVNNKVALPFYLWLLLISTLLLSCSIFRSISHGECKITDYKLFPFRTISSSTKPFHYNNSISQKSTQAIDTCSLGEHGLKNISFIDLLDSTETVAFLIVKNDSIIYEKYFIGYGDTSEVVAFSMTKSFFSFLFECAIDDGIIKSVQEPVSSYIPEIVYKYTDTLRIEHLLNMTSGFHYNEPTSNPFGLHNRLYWGDDIEEELGRLKFVAQPGKTFKYKSLDNQLLAVILKRTLKNETITEYMERRMWHPMGMEFGAIWSTDAAKRIEKTFSSLTARPRDIIKFGSLALEKGWFNGMQIMSKDWFRATTSRTNTDGASQEYHYQWWNIPNDTTFLYASGSLGQLLFIDRANRIVILRMGKKRVLKTAQWIDIFRSLSTGRLNF